MCGYEPNLAALAADGLRYLRDDIAGSAFASVPLQFQEYGTLGNKEGRVSCEPGACIPIYRTTLYVHAHVHTS